MGNLTVKPQVGFAEAVKTGLARLTDFKSRSRRSEFWWFMLAFVIVNYIVNFVCTLAMPVIMTIVISTLMMFFAFAVTVRRLHDTGKSGWWVVISWVASAVVQFYYSNMIAHGVLESGDPQQLLVSMASPLYWVSALVALVTSIAVIIFCILDGKPESNKYGASPKYVSAEEVSNEEVQE